MGIDDGAASRVNAAPVTVTTCDGLSLGARLYVAESCGKPVIATVVNAGAGIRQKFYEPFARFLAQNGIPALTYDYRGIGASRPSKWRGFNASVEDWGSKDCAAALDWMNNRFPQSKLGVVAHSVGALVTGFVTNGRLIEKMLFIGPHTGYWGDYRLRWRPLMFLGWHVAMPAITRAFGYFPGRALRLGDNIPNGVALEWAARYRADLWSMVKDERGKRDAQRIADFQHRFGSIHANVLAIRFRNDPFATRSAVARVLKLFPNCQSRVECGSMPHVGTANLGHFGFFRPERAGSTWDHAILWLLD